ncbi:MAG: hypothetical protein IRY99_17000, partial [Isosphaeraceae bacterium]|nr:hypothetical protein [Isosphaeraceae bacterium]
MARVSLILPALSGSPAPAAQVRPYQEALEDAGHEVEIVVGAALPGAEASWRVVAAPVPGAAAAAIAALEQAGG